MMKTRPCVLSCFVPGKQLTNAVTNAFSQMHSVRERRKCADWIVVLVPCCSILHWLCILILFSYLQLLFPMVWVSVLNQLVPFKATECEVHSVHSLSGPSPTLSLGTFLQECSYRLLGRCQCKCEENGLQIDLGLPQMAAACTNYIG